MRFKCNICKNELFSPGALIFSPPFYDGTFTLEGNVNQVLKYHVCITCWDTLVKFMINGGK